MTLDVHGMSRQLDGMVTYLRGTLPERQARQAQAEAAYAAVTAEWQSVEGRLDASRLGYLAAVPLEDPARAYPPPPLAPPFTVVATDGSQIEPERHAAAECFVLNVGWAVLHYGPDARAELGNAAELRFRDEELWFDLGSRRVPIREELLATLRTLVERRKLAELLEAQAGPGPVLGLADGSLLDWTLENRSRDLPPAIEAETLALLDRMRASGALLASYVSRPASREVANLARLPLCSDPPLMDCRVCSSRERFGVAACAPADGLTDGAIFWPLLPPYHRSALFAPRQRVQERYRGHTMCCFYLNAGPEIGRVELPEWVARDAAKLALAHALVADQCRRGRYHGKLPGYPPALVEAHEQAVVDGADRQIFAQLLERRLQRAGLPAELSAKRLSKQMKAV